MILHEGLANWKRRLQGLECVLLGTVLYFVALFLFIYFCVLLQCLRLAEEDIPNFSSNELNICLQSVTWWPAETTRYSTVPYGTVY
jgi:hypothetical protein